MKRLVWILIGSLILAQPGLALKDKPASPEPESRREKLSNELGVFVREAMKEGLLEPSGTPKNLQPAPVEPQPPSEPVVEAAPVSVQPQAPLDCTVPYPLDFAGFDQLKRYSDIYYFREESPSGGAELHEAKAFGTTIGHPGANLAKAYIALDLAPEAAMTVKSGRTYDAVALQNLASLLEGKRASPTAYFASLSECFPQANIWHALSLLADGDANGAALFEASLGDFRTLPLQMRDRAAFIAVPALDAAGRRDLAELVMAAFTPEEIAGSSQLQFSQAVYQVGEGDAAAEALLGRFIVQSRFEEPALSALVRHKRPVSDTVRFVLVDEIVTRIELAQSDQNIRDDLRFVLGELSAASMYEPMMKLAEVPSLQSPVAREELLKGLVTSLRRDLDSDDSLRNMAAIEALLQDPGLLDGLPERAGLYEKAMEVAVRLGFGSLGASLSDKAQGGAAVAEQRALLDYRQKDYPQLFGLATQYPASQKINLIAARAAIDLQDRAKLRVLESRLRLDEEAVLALIEQDAATGGWIVSEHIYDAAVDLTGEAAKARVARVLKLRNAPEEFLPASERLPMSAIPTKLAMSRQSIDKLSGDTP